MRVPQETSDKSIFCEKFDPINVKRIHCHYQFRHQH